MKPNYPVPFVFFAVMMAFALATGTAAPATRIPIDSTNSLSAEQWKDESWQDGPPLPEIRFDGLPLQDVINDLRIRFTNAFDILTPSEWQDPHDPARFSGAPFDPVSTLIKMELRNVTASEVFHAMNMVFDAEN